MLIYVRPMTGTAVSFDVPMSMSVSDLKVLVAAAIHVPTSAQRLLFGGSVLRDESVLHDCGVSKECVLQLFATAAKSDEGIPPAADTEMEEKKYDDIPSELRFGDLVLVNLIEARNLKKADLFRRSSDPYAIMVVGSDSARSRTIKRNINPMWNESFGFRVEEQEESVSHKTSVLSVIVFDYDNFTPDDFIGSIEVDLSTIKRGEMLDTWIPLEHVKTGEVHIQVQRGMLTSPAMGQVVRRLSSLERSWGVADLVKYDISTQQLMGELPWLVKKETVNPALRNLRSLLRSGTLNWSYGARIRVARILQTQNKLPSCREMLPTRYVWVSGIPRSFTPLRMRQLIRKKLNIVIKHIICPEVPHAGFAVLSLRSLDDTTLLLMSLQDKELGTSRLVLGFGPPLPVTDPYLENCTRGGFLNVCAKGSDRWQYCWLFLLDSILYVLDNLNSEKRMIELSLKDCFVCSHGICTVEVFDCNSDNSFFLKSNNEDEMNRWKRVLRQAKQDGGVGKHISRSEGVFEDYQCSMCGDMVPTELIYTRDLKDDLSCISCLRKDVISHIDAGTCDQLHSTYTINDIRELLHPDEFEVYLDSALVELLDTDKSFVKCPSCELAVEFCDEGEHDVPNFSRVSGIDRAPLNGNAKEHYLGYRVRCRSSVCQSDFCRSCLETPYHAGFSCDEYQLYKVAEHCRFCDRALMPGMIFEAKGEEIFETLINVCNSEVCLAKRAMSCTRILDCGCYCRGVRNESTCLPCLEHAPSQVLIGQDHADDCMFCTDPLISTPSIQLYCGHVFHYPCLQQKLDAKWTSAHISFGFVQCPLCQIRIEHPLLEAELAPIKELYKEIEYMAMARLEYEGLSKEDEIVNIDGDFYHNAAGFSVSYFAYYMCFKCQKPYFGGKIECGQNMENFDPSELVCGGCSGVGVEECPKHGKDYIIFKCKFCCSPGAWYCWGSTHFCNDCHRRQEAHDYMTTKPVEELDVCLGPETCPLKVEHPPNGTEFSLGCGLCKGTGPPAF